MLTSLSPTHCLILGPVFQHEIFKVMLAVCTVFLVRCEIKLTIESRVSYHFVNKETLNQIS